MNLISYYLLQNLHGHLEEMLHAYWKHFKLGNMVKII